jgi:ankyrin repeat protein
VDIRRTEGTTPLFWAIRDLACTRLLVEAGPNVNASDDRKCTPLFLAADEGDERVAEYLLRHDADPDAKQDEGYTPLIVAAEYGNIGTVRVLLSHGAEVAARSDDGQTALSLAEKNGHAETVLLLKSALSPAPRAGKTR